VINITTKRGRGAPTMSAFFEYGSFKSIREGGAVSGQKGPVDFSATVSRWDVTSFSVINYRRGAAERDGYNNWHSSARLGIALPQDARLNFNLRWMDNIVNTDGFAIVGGRNDPADVLGAKNTRDQLILTGNFTQPLTHWCSHQLTVGRAVNNLSGQTGTFRRNLVTGQTENLQPRLFDIASYNNRIEWQHTVQVAKPVQVVAGYQFREQVGRSKGRFDTKIIASHAGFADVQLNLWDRLFGTAGLRQDVYNMFGSATTYRVTAGYRHQETDTKIRGSYATGFRPPTLSQLYFPGFGTLNLQPEHSQGLDVGIDQAFFDKRVTLSTGYFWTRYQDLLLSIFDPVRCSFSPLGFCSQNIGAAKAHGWESSLTVNLLEDRPWIKRLDIHGQDTHTLTRDLAVRSGNRLPLWPVHQWSSVISYQPIEPLQVNLEFRYVGQRFNDTQNREFLPAFDVWNAAATYTINKRLQVYTRVDNLFDRKYEERLFLGTPGRSIYGGVRVSFDVP
jgi:vitamin B12 transporter